MKVTRTFQVRLHRRDAPIVVTQQLAPSSRLWQHGPDIGCSVPPGRVSLMDDKGVTIMFDGTHELFMKCLERGYFKPV